MGWQSAPLAKIQTYGFDEDIGQKTFRRYQSMNDVAHDPGLLHEIEPFIMNNSTSPGRSLPEDQWQSLYRIMGGHIYFQTLSAAVRLDLFGVLKEHGPLTRSEIANCLDIAEKPARILLLGCTALNLLKKSGDRYENTDLANALLVRSVPGNIVSIIEWQHFINYRPMFYFYEALKSNRNVGLQVFDGEESTLYERLTHHPELEEIFQNAMEAISVQANAMLAEHGDFSQVRCLVDVGGGNASNIIALARRNPRLHAIVFDSPSVCEIAKRNIAESGLSDRLDAIPGNCFEDAFPDGVDCILFGHFFTIWSEEKNRELLAKCYHHLPPGGRVMIFNMMQSDDETGPLTAALGSPYFLTLATGGGMLYTWQEYERWLKEAGFSQVTSQAMQRDHGLIIGNKP